VLSGLALAFILTDSFAFVLGFAGFTLVLFSLLTVLGLMRLRRREPGLERPFRAPWYPLPPLLFALIASASLLAVALEQPLAVLGGSLALLVLWFALDRAASRARPPEDRVHAGE
jgi:APA family basic amino acid/polyamine antiporter